LRPYGQLRRRPQLAVHVGIDRRHHVRRTARARRDRRPYLIQPSEPVPTVERGGGRAVGQGRSVARKDGQRAEQLEQPEAVQVLAQVTVGVRDDRGASTQDRVSA
jgi:hypothetical protein